MSAGGLDARFQAFLDAAPDAMVVADARGRIIAVNAHATRLFDYPRADLVGAAIEALVPDAQRARHLRDREAYQADPHSRPMGAGLDLSGRRHDGSEFPVEISLSPLVLDDARLVIAAIRDITARRRLEESIREQNRVLEEQNRRVHAASRMKSEFLANMSHELRTPLNSIIGFSELMHDGRVGPIAENHREYLGDILSSARHLLRLINDVLDLAKVESGKMQFLPESVDLEVLVKDLRDQVRGIAAAKRIRLEADVDDALHRIVIDPSRLAQILYNFLSNALKFTPEDGHVTVRGRVEDDEFFRIEVEDSGPGINEADLERLFVEFQQLDDGPAKRHQGTGLGLALTRRMVESQGGRVGGVERTGTRQPVLRRAAALLGTVTGGSDPWASAFWSSTIIR